MTGDRPYVPIDCNYYDRLEAWSVKREVVKIKLANDLSCQIGKIDDLYIKDKVEYLILDSLVEIRLDEIESVNGIFLEHQ